MAPVKKLIPVLGLDQAALSSIRTVLARNKSYLYIKRKIDIETADRVKALNLAGIAIEEEPQRFYPLGGSAASCPRRSERRQ